MSDSNPSLPFVIADRYEVVAELGRGGFATVYRAMDRRLTHEVAIKLLRDETLSNSSMRRFSLEMRVMADLEHPKIVHIYDSDTWNDRLYYVMELVRGPTLAARLAEEGALPIEDALAITRDVGEALAFAHRHGVIHRDVKPDNILIGPYHAKLSDFGVAYVLGESPQAGITSTGVAVGTARFMSPEQLFAERKIDARADQYSLALICYEMLCGVPPHVASSVEGLRLLRLDGSIAPIVAHRPSIPGAVDSVIRKALAPIPADRYRDVNELLVALDAAMAESSPHASGSAHGSLAEGRAAHGASGERFDARTASAPGLIRVAPDPSYSPDAETPQWPVDSAAPVEKASRARWSMRIAVSTLILALIAIGSWALKSRRISESYAGTSLRVGVLASRTGSDSGFATRVRRELDEWRDVTIASGLSGAGTLSDESPSQLRTIAQRAGADLVIQPAVEQVGDSTRWTISVFNVSSGQVRRITQESAGRSIGGRTLRAMMLRVLVGVAADSASGIETLPDASLGAARAYARGWSWIRTGPLDSARNTFARAAERAPLFGAAHLWSAQVDEWLSPKTPATWEPLARRALATHTLASADSILAEALVRLASNPPAACAVYRAALNRTPDSFAAQFGLGRCMDADSIVVHDERTKSLRFRSSLWSALRAFDRALDDMPGVGVSQLFGNVTKLTFAEGNTVRLGFAFPPDTSRYGAVPSFGGDSIEMVPLRWAEITQGGATPETFSLALNRGRQALLDFTRHWVARAPSSADAWYSRASALELTGNYEAPDEMNSASKALIRAARLPSGSELRAKIDVSRVRVTVRRGDLATAERLASAATKAQPASAMEAIVRAPLAAFLRDVPTLTSLLRIAASSNDPGERRLLPPWVANGLPVWLADSLRAFGVRAIAGQCDELPQRRLALEQDLKAHLASAEFESQHRDLLHQIYREAVPCLGASVLRGFPPADGIEEAIAALDSGDLVVARSAMDRLAAVRRGMNRASVTKDVVLLEAWVWTQLGDADHARAIVERSMKDLASMSPFTFQELSQAAALGRLRARPSKA